MEITVLPVASLRPYNENYRHHEADQIEHLSASVDEFGQYKPIVVSQDHVILAGHGIWQTHQAKGLSDIACVVMPFDHKDPKAEKLLVVDNESARLARDDSKQLTALLADIQRTEGLQGTGWSDQELDRLIGELAAEDFGASVGREVEETDWPELADGDRAPFQQMTFTLSDGQAETVKAAMQAAKSAGPFVDTGNENSNGNALARICEAYCG